MRSLALCSTTAGFWEPWGNHLRPEGCRGVWRWGRRPGGCGCDTGPRHSRPEVGAHRARWGVGGARAQCCAGTWRSHEASTSAFGPGMPCWMRGCLWTGKVDASGLCTGSPCRASGAGIYGESFEGRVLGIPRTRPLHSLHFFIALVHFFALTHLLLCYNF